MNWIIFLLTAASSFLLAFAIATAWLLKVDETLTHTEAVFDAARAVVVVALAAIAGYIVAAGIYLVSVGWL